MNSVGLFSTVLPKTEWPEMIPRVQSLAESGLNALPSRYIRPQSDRPKDPTEELDISQLPVIDMACLQNKDSKERTLIDMDRACREWGFFQVINHGVPPWLMQRAAAVSKMFFEQPSQEKERYANDPITYEGYGSRVGTEKGAVLDWSDYFYINCQPTSKRNLEKWPTKPLQWRGTIEDYSQYMSDLADKLLEAFSCNLGLEPSALKEAFGGTMDCELSLRFNYYPTCPQPDLTLGLSSHSDPGGLTVLFQAEGVDGLQVRHNGLWISVNPLPGALIINLGDQLQILTNDKYRSVEHRVLVNKERGRLSLACFVNPGNEILLAPLEKLIDDKNPPRYEAMTFKRYRSFIRNRGNKGKGYVDAIRSTTTEER